MPSTPRLLSSPTLATLAAALLLAATPVAAQLAQLPAGAYIRVSWSDTTRGVSHRGVTGDVVSTTTDALTIRVPRVTDPITVPRASIMTIERSQGKSARRTATVAGVMGAVMWTGLAYWGNGSASSGKRVGTALAFGAAGGTLGAVLGARFPAEHWVKVSP